MTPLPHIQENVPAHEILVYMYLHQQAVRASQRPEYFKETKLPKLNGMKGWSKNKKMKKSFSLSKEKGSD